MSRGRKDPRALALDFQAQHRERALEKQASARSDTLCAKRLAQLAHAGSIDEEVQASIIGSKRAVTSSDALSPERGRRLYARQLMLPEWMLEVPQDLATQWYVAARPEGVRCLVIATGALTTARLRNGVVQARFESVLPGGGAVDPGGEDGYTILDCVYSQADETYYLMDLMCWRGHSVYDCTAEFRLFWLASKLSELPPQGKSPRFCAVAFTPATPEGLRRAYEDASLPYQRDGLAFIHREAHYVPGPSLLTLLWKDALCSRYFIDTDKQGVTLPQQQLVLVYQMDGTVVTGDEPGWALGRLPVDFVQKLGTKLVPGTLLRFELGPGGFTLQQGKPVGADLRLLGSAGSRRGRADPLSKILFQHLARTGPLTVETLLDVAEQGVLSVME